MKKKCVFCNELIDPMKFEDHTQSCSNPLMTTRTSSDNQSIVQNDSFEVINIENEICSEKKMLLKNRKRRMNE